MKYPAYPKYKPSGIEWLGKVPEHWETNTIKYTTYVKGRIGWQGLRFDEFIDEGPYLVTGIDFKNGEVDWSTCYHISDERYREDPYIQLRNDDLLITKDGTIGKVAIVAKMPGPACLNSGVFVTRARRATYVTKYMYWLLCSSVFDGFIESQKSGTTIAHLYQNVFVEFRYSVPSIYEQRAIADFLDAETAKLDTLVAKKRELIEKLKEKRTALISRAVTRGLPPEAARAAGFNPNTNLKPSGIEWLGDVPEHWEVKRLKFYLTRIEQGWSPQCENTPADLDDWGVLKVGAVNGSRFDPLENKRLPDSEQPLAQYEILPGDFLLSRANTRALLGSAAVVSSVTHRLLLCDKLYRLKLRHSDLTQDFLLFFLRSVPGHFEFEQEATGASNSMQNISQDAVRNLWASVPPVSEQQAIAEYLTNETVKIDRMVAKVESAIERLREYRIALITAAVTGKIDVRSRLVETRQEGSS